MSDASETPAEVAEAAGGAALRAALRGALGFAAVGVAGFAFWAFAGVWFRHHEAGLFAGCAAVFIGLSGLLLSPLVQGPGAMVRFYKIFVPAFIVYAMLWCAGWFALGFGWGEWLGSILGSAGFVAMVGRGLGSFRSFARVVVAMIVLHSAGYFLGGKAMGWVGGPKGAEVLSGLSKGQISALAKLSWGLIYGLGFGAGMGYAFFTFQRRSEDIQTPPTRAV